MLETAIDHEVLGAEKQRKEKVGPVYISLACKFDSEKICESRYDELEASHLG